MDRTFRRPFCPNLRFSFLVSTMPGIRAWSDDLVAVLFEFLDDDTKLAQSCTDWLYVQHWYTVVPDPAMRVTLWALMGAGGNCEVCHTTGPLTPFCVVFSVSAEGSGTGNRDAMGSSVCVLRCLCVIPWHLRGHGFSLVTQSMARRRPLPAQVRRDAFCRFAL